MSASEETFVALTGPGGRRCLWPSSIAAPSGWIATEDPDEIGSCLRIIERTWPAIRIVNTTSAVGD